MSDIPEWALRRAGELMGYKTALHTGDSWWWTWESSLAFARYISEHEEPPVDPLLEGYRAALRVATNTEPYRLSEMAPFAAKFGDELAKAGLQIVPVQS